MRTAPRNLRLHIGFFGRRNVGKSSLLNALTRQAVAIVSETPGTTTDPVEKPMELLPLGPVVFIDTAGIDDEGALGEQRIAKTRLALERTDLALLVVAAGQWGRFEDALLEEIETRGVGVLVCFNKSDLALPSEGLLGRLSAAGVPFVLTSAHRGGGASELRRELLRAAPSEHFESRRLAGDLVAPGEIAVLVVPIDKEAPKGRLILPQGQVIRDLLDNDAVAVVAKDRELGIVLEGLSRPPSLVVTDSQAFREVALATPREIPLTSFSILFSRFQGDLIEQVRGTPAIERLRDGDKILVAEGCTHHPIGDDIGRVKIPRWLKEYTGAALEIDTVCGRDFPDDLSPYALVIHCGNCMGNRREMLSRILRCREAGVAITNYGLTIAFSLGILDRALEPFPLALEAYRVSAES